LGQKLSEFFDLLMGFRKLIVFILLLVISATFLLSHNIDGGQWTDLMKAVAVSFFGSNSIEHFTSMVQDHLASKSDPKE
jgi:hypothetical protein